MRLLALYAVAKVVEDYLKGGAKPEQESPVDPQRQGGHL
jgi:hypothetical protein